MGQTASKEQLVDLLCEELRLDVGCIGECCEVESTVLCLVEQQWLAGITSLGLVSAPVYDGDHTSVAWLQAAVHECSKLLDGWQRVAIRVIAKPTDAERSAQVLVPPCNPQMTSCVVSADGGSAELHHYADGLSWLAAHVQYSQAAITSNAMATDGSVKTPRVPLASSVTTSFVQQVLDQLYGGVHVHTLEHAELPSFVPAQPEGHFCHPGFLPVLGAVESAKAFYIFHASPPPSLRQAVAYSPAFLTQSTSRPLFIIYQLLQILSECHLAGATHGKLDLDSVLVDTDLWVQLYQLRFGIGNGSGGGAQTGAAPPSPTAAAASVVDRPLASSSCDLSSLVRDWVDGRVSNFDYLMALNGFAGRRPGNPNQHPVIPWVVDFTKADGGWRDLSRSKFRLNKGDDQLDFTFKSQLPPLGSSLSASAPVSLLPPHHVSDILSDITYYVYLARRMPRSLLCRYVRSKWVPHEYPTSMHRMMLWTPDECIPELFSDASVFRSVHDDLPDLEVPAWTATPELFVAWHRSMLESDQVSKHLHRWIDLTFGYQLAGRHAEKAKNICLQLVQQHDTPMNHGVTQLFRRPHPQRKLATVSVPEGTSEGGWPFADDTPSTPVAGRWIPLAMSANTSLVESPTKLKSPLSGSTPASHSPPPPPLESDITSTSSSFTSVHAVTSDAASQVGSAASLNVAARLDFAAEVADAALGVPDTNSGDSTDSSPPPLAAGGSTTTDGGSHSTEDSVQFEVEYPSTQVFELKSRTRPAAKKDEKPLAKADSEVGAGVQKSAPVSSGSKDLAEAAPAPAAMVAQVLPSDETVKSTRLEKSTFFASAAQPALVSGRPLGLFTARPAKEGGVPECLSKAIELPDSCRPLALLESVDAMEIFLADCQAPGGVSSARCDGESDEAKRWPHSATAEAESSPSPALAANPSSFVQRVHFDMQCLACIAVQMLLPGVRAMLLGEESLQKKIDVIRTAAGCRLSVLPSCIRHAVVVLLGLKQADAASAYIPDVLQRCVLPHSPAPQLSPLFSYFQFPAYFCKLYGFLRMLKQWRAHPETCSDPTAAPDLSASDTLLQTMQLSKAGSVDQDGGAESAHHSHLISRVSQHLPQLLPILDAEAFSTLLLPHLMPLFSTQQNSPKVAAEAMCRLFDILARRLGPAQTSRFFLKPLFGLLELMLHVQASDLERSLALLLNTSFLNQVVNRFGLVSFLDHFVPVLINIVTTPLIKKPGETPPPPPPPPTGKDKARSEDDRDPPAPAPPEVIKSPFVQLGADALLWLSQLLGPTLTTQHVSHALMNQLYQCFPVTVDVVSLGHYTSKYALSAVQCLVNIVILFGEPLLLDDYIKRLLDMVRYSKSGGILTIKEQQRIAAALSFFRTLLPLMSQHVLLDSFEMFHQSLFYPTIKLLSSTIHCFPGGFVARSAICQLLVDTLVILGHRLGRDEAQHLLEFPLQQLFACFDPYAPRFGQGAAAEAMRSESPAAIGEQEVRALFKPALAHSAYIPFCQLIGQIRMRELIFNHELIEQLAYSYDTQEKENKLKLNEEYHTTWRMLTSMSERAPLISSSFSVLAVGETLSDVEELDLDEDSPVSGLAVNATALPKPEQLNLPWTMSIDNETALVGDMKDLVRELHTADTSTSMPSGRPPNVDLADGGATGTEVRHPAAPFTPGGNPDATSPFFRGVSAVDGHRHLAGTWLDQWSSSLGGRMGTFSFQHRKLQTFGGHAGTVRCLHVHPQEHLLLSGGRDKTVRLWSLANNGDGSSCMSSRHDYRKHQKPISFVHLVERTGAVASFDGSLHLWDPQTGCRLKQMEFSRNIVTLAALPPPYPQLVAASSDGILKFIDVRIGRMQHEYRLLSQPGQVRCLCADAGGNSIAVGYSTGTVGLLEQRTGTLQAFWRGHDADVLQIRSPAEHHFMTSSSDQTISLWHDSTRGERTAIFRGHTEAVHCLSFLNEHMISVSTGNKLGVHSSMDEHAVFQSWKIKNELFKGGINSIGVLPTNRLLLLAGDSGQISLIS